MSNNKDDENLVGFKEFIDSTEDLPTKKKTYTDNSMGFELFSFLENESKRLSNKISLLEEKSFMLKNYPQDIQLIVKQEDKNKALRLQVIEKLKKRGSPVFDSMREVFEDHFK